MLVRLSELKELRRKRDVEDHIDKFYIFPFGEREDKSRTAERHFGRAFGQSSSMPKLFISLLTY